MAEDWAADVKKYVADADDGIIAGIVRYCGIALQKRDSSLVSFTDPKETDRVRENFLKKKLGLTQSNDKLDAAIAAVGLRMKGENFKNRVTVYYLLAENFGLLGMFAKAAKATKATKAAPATKGKSGAVKAAAGTAAVASLASLGAKDSDKGKSGGVVGAAGAAGAAALGAVGAVASGTVSGAKAVGEEAVEAASAVGAAVAGAAGAVGSAASAAGSGIASATSSAAQALTGGTLNDSDDSDAGWGWLIWLLLAALVLGVLWWLFRGKAEAPAASGVTTEQIAPASDAAAAAPAAPPPAEGTVAIPTGAGVTTEARDGKPVVKVYFDTGKADVVPAFGAAAGGLKAWLDSHADSSLAVSGFNDKTGNAALNAELSKKRAQAVKAALVASGIADASVALVKPADTTGNDTDNAGARRVEVVVK